jgi:hypothetical protein
MISFTLLPFLDGESAFRIPEGFPLACLLKLWRDLDPEDLLDSSFTIPSAGHNT